MDVNLICVGGGQVNDKFEIDDSLVELSGPVYRVIVSEHQSYFIREGTWFEKDESGEFQPDWSLTWIYKDEDDPKSYAYYEQSPKETAVYNFIKSLGG